MKSFSNWSIEEVEDEFGLKPVLTSRLLEQWLVVTSSPSEFEQQFIEILRGRLAASSYSWNEIEFGWVHCLKWGQTQRKKLRGGA